MREKSTIQLKEHNMQQQHDPFKHNSFSDPKAHKLTEKGVAKLTT